jgi:hypothetical protein
MSVPSEPIVPRRTRHPSTSHPAIPIVFPMKSRFPIPNRTNPLILSFVRPLTVRRGVFFAVAFACSRGIEDGQPLGDDLRLELEDFVDSLVVNGARQSEVYQAIKDEIESLKAAYGGIRILQRTIPRPRSRSHLMIGRHHPKADDSELRRFPI